MLRNSMSGRVVYRSTQINITNVSRSTLLASQGSGECQVSGKNCLATLTGYVVMKNRWLHFTNDSFLRVGADGIGCPETKHGLEEGSGEDEPCEDGECNAIPTGCASSRYGCCEDGETRAEGPNYFCCPGTEESIGGCAGTMHGCCPDGSTAALGANREGCDETGSGEAETEVDCRASAFGCCPDLSSAAEGANYEGCDVDCDMRVYGCCPDGVSAASGPDFVGCPEEGTYIATCADSTYACCPNGKTAALGPDNAGCPSVIAKRGRKIFIE